ncbi:Ycf48-like protein [Thalassoporum mexicanum PCC 7367]|nr:Ycf48-like protein [Pseudanabaena sp. PCC 7367]
MAISLKSKVLDRIVLLVFSFMNYLKIDRLWQRCCQAAIATLFVMITCTTAIVSHPQMAIAQDQRDQQNQQDLEYWHQVELPTDVTLLDLDFTDNQKVQHGWLVGTNSTLLETTDGGETWQPKKLDLGKINYRFVSVSFNGDEGWIVGRPSLLLHTEDGGKSWQRIGLSSRLPGDPAMVTALGPKTLEMATDIGAIYRSEDGARTWQALVREAVGTTRNLFRSDDGRYIAVSAKGNFYSTWAPGDRAWTPHNRNNSRRVQNMGYTPDGRIWMLNRGGVLQFSESSNTENWEEPQNPKAASGYGMLDMSFQDANNVWVSGGSSRLLHSEDGGQTWHREEYLSNVGANFYRVFFFNHDRGFILGQFGTLLTYDPENAT